MGDAYSGYNYRILIRGIFAWNPTGAEQKVYSGCGSSKDRVRFPEDVLVVNEGEPVIR